MQKIITIDVAIDNPYTVMIGKHLDRQLSSFVLDKFSDHRKVIITDDNVYSLYGPHFEKLLHADLIVTVAAGEQSKCRKVKEELENKLLANNFGRDTIIFALGGGVIGDLAGFIAATYNRGIPFIQIPTTLLAMVDASVGGKTGINTVYGKNLIGCFWHPVAVFASLSLLQTLKQEDYLNGMAEAVKMAVAFDEDFFERFCRIEDMRKSEWVAYCVKRCVELKSDVVTQDPRESGLRRTLNYGHTAGHAIESCSKYSLKHGLCVGIGMIIAGKISVEMGLLTSAQESRIKKTLEKLGLPTVIPDDITGQQMIDYMKKDKKSQASLPRFVLLESIGQLYQNQGEYVVEVDEQMILKAIAQCRQH